MSLVSIAILAAGNASRMGTPKQLLPYNNTSLLGHALQVANASTAVQTFCVIGAHADLIQKYFQQTEVHFVKNPDWSSGLSSSIVQAVNKVMAIDETEALLIMLADQPMITTAYLNTIIDLHYKNPKRVVASRYENGFGVPALFPKSHWNDLQQLKGDQGAKIYLNEGKERVLSLDAKHMLADIDTPEDYKELIHSKA